MKISELESRLKEHATITKYAMQTPFDLKEEIKNMEERTMSKPKITIKRTMTIVAVLTLCLVIVCMTPLASSIRGFFSDIVRFDGAITGTKYENATNEIKVYATEITTNNGKENIALEFTFENPNEAPYAYMQEIAVSDYMVIDETTGEILKLVCYPAYSGKGAINDGKAVVNLSTDDAKLKSGEEYTIVIEKMYGLSKADAPLLITGTWNCSFIR